MDLGKLIQAYGGIPDIAVKKATQAYGADIARKVVWVVNRLQNAQEFRHMTETLQMDHALAIEALDALRAECRRVWPNPLDE